MPIKRLMIANRGEIAIRIFRTARNLGMEVVGIAPKDDQDALHARKLPQIAELSGEGTPAYLDIEDILTLAKAHRVDAIHPGYGFLSENATFAKRCQEEGLIFIGPDAKTLERLSDKSSARSLAIEASVPVLAGRNEATSLEAAKAFFEDLESGSGMFIKAIAGGGGRGMRLVTEASEIEEAYESAAREAKASFGNSDLYVERYMPDARHIEVQILGDGTDVMHFHERECSLQRRNQKVLEIAPAVDLVASVKKALLEAALRMADSVSYKGLGTFEFLVSANDDSYAFMEANPRIQVEHTVTEEILGVDLVEAQLRVFAGESLKAQGLSDREPQGYAIQARINAEHYNKKGRLLPSGGAISRNEVPQGRGVRIDSAAFVGWKSNPRYDSLLAKLIVSDPRGDYQDVLSKLDQALGEYEIEGVKTSIGFLRALIQQEAVRKGPVTTNFIDAHLPDILTRIEEPKSIHSEIKDDGLETQKSPEISDNAVLAPLPGTVVSYLVAAGDVVRKGQELVVLEAMKMEHLILAPHSGTVTSLHFKAGETLNDGSGLLHLEPSEDQAEDEAVTEDLDLDHIRPDLADLLEKKLALLDEARPEAVAKRRSKGKNMIRENIGLLVDEGSFSEYGGLNLAAQRSRHSVEVLEKISPADGMVCGTGSVNSDQFGEEASAVAILGYDYTVFAGTQGGMNHKKTDRILHLAEERRLPIIFYGEGGGGRPGDTDIFAASTLDVPTFQTYARMSGLVPRIAIASGRCFAGNAALMGVSDILIATKDTSIGMGGPAMIEGGGLGVYTPEEVGPVSVQGPNGVIDVLVEDEAEATKVAKKVLSYFQGCVSEFEEHDQRELRFAIPENRLRVYDIRTVIDLLGDKGSVLELRPEFAKGMLTGFMRIGGQPVGYIANNPKHLGGAIDADGSEKAARHIQLCDAFDIPILSLCDTPGFMVGPEAEKTALVRKTSRLFAAAGSITVPVYTLILRKGYGLGAQAMAGGSMHVPFVTLAWPTGEMGPMGLEGAVRLGFKKELAAIEDEAERQKTFEAMVAKAYKRGKATNAAAFMEIDDVIDPATSRERLIQAIKASHSPTPRTGKKRTFVDTW
ncbi:carboxyl transferase domain-containing protein [Sneathiella limimaris]|uniref:carboxyl transferase domain-containing protein n=1 Tax=Sneathiella limimaris TaxID=1964213 RepID=UPI00146D60EE|nr:carboxyl transferase domain-containing protein [Sneathiella limimaris]